MLRLKSKKLIMLTFFLQKLQQYFKRTPHQVVFFGVRQVYVALLLRKLVRKCFKRWPKDQPRPSKAIQIICLCHAYVHTSTTDQYSNKRYIPQDENAAERWRGRKPSQSANTTILSPRLAPPSSGCCLVKKINNS